MKFFFRSCYGESLAIALRVAEDGNDVRFFISDRRYKAVGDGLIPKARDLVSGVGWADIVVYDGTDKDAPDEAERVRKTGKPVVGGAAFAEKLEHDRPFAVSLIEADGVEVPRHHAFKGKAAFIQAQKFVSSQREETGWVWKPDGEPPNFFQTFVAHSREEIMRRLDALQEASAELSGSEAWVPNFLLQEKVEGIEVSTEAWWWGNGFVVPNGTLERKWLMNGDLGEQTGCMGNIVWRYPSMDEAPLAQRLLAPLAKELNGRYRGPIDVNAIVRQADGEPLFLEFTPRFGYSAIFALSSLVQDFPQLLADTAKGVAYKETPPTAEFAAGVRVTIPPYPYHTARVAERRPVFGWEGDFDPTIHPYEVRVNDHGDIETSGPDGIVFEVTGLGSTIREATGACYAAIDTLYIPDMRYRTDIGEQAERDYAGLVDLELVEGERTEQGNDWF